MGHAHTCGVDQVDDEMIDYTQSRPLPRGGNIVPPARPASLIAVLAVAIAMILASVLANGPREALAQDEGAFVYWVQSGEAVRGPSLDLRPAKELVRLRKALSPWPRLGFEAGGTRRLDVSDDAAGNALALAWRALTEASETLPRANSLPRDQQVRLWMHIDWARAIVQALGDEESAARLMALRNGQPFFDDRLVQSAALLDARFGRLEDGIVRQTFDSLDDPTGAQALALALALAEHGDPFALNQMVWLLAGGAQMTYAPDVYYRPLAASDLPSVKEFFRLSLEAYRSAAHENWQAVEAGLAPPGRVDGSILPYAILALAETAEQETSGLPIDILTLDNRILPLVEEPQQLFALFAGIGDRTGSHGAIATRHGLSEAFCLAQTWRTAGAAEAIYEALTEILISAETGGRAVDAQERRNWFLTTSLLSAQCRRSRDLVEQFAKRSDAEAESALFGQEKAIAWARRPLHLDAMVREFRQTGTGLRSQSADLFRGGELEAHLTSLPDDLQATRDLFLAKTNAVSNAYVVNRVYAGGADRRVALRRLDGDDASVAVFALVDVKPRIDGDKLQLGIRLSVDHADSDGLGSAISGKGDRLAAALADAAGNMIERVAILSGGHSTDLAHRATTRSGVHVFETALPPQGLSDLTGHVVLRLLDTTFTIDLPLHSGHFAFRRRIDGEQ